jgi:maleylpyruvate isomerase
MKLYNYWRSSSSYRVRLALEFKQLSYDYVAVPLLEGAQNSDAHKARSPWGSVPVLEVEEGGTTLQLPQSVAIVEYLEERFPTPPLFPAAAAARAQMRSLVELINASIQPFHNLSALTYLREVLKADEKAWADHWVAKGLAALEQQAQASAGQFLVGDAFTFADACLMAQLYAARRFASAPPEKYPTLMRIEATCLALDFVKRAAPDAQPDARPS